MSAITLLKSELSNTFSPETLIRANCVSAIFLSDWSDLFTVMLALFVVFSKAA
ncbi:hypothetical protein [Ruminococcus sp.]|uniref:hypothetical protein n=1 Tax=Ruminococcus sp. TaxID=41978 RepID=UPI003F80318A